MVYQVYYMGTTHETKKYQCLNKPRDYTAIGEKTGGNFGLNCIKPLAIPVGPGAAASDRPVGTGKSVIGLTRRRVGGVEHGAFGRRCHFRLYNPASIARCTNNASSASKCGVGTFAAREPLKCREDRVDLQHPSALKILRHGGLVVVDG